MPYFFSPVLTVLPLKISTMRKEDLGKCTQILYTISSVLVRDLSLIGDVRLNLRHRFIFVRKRGDRNRSAELDFLRPQNGPQGRGLSVVFALWPGQHGDRKCSRLYIAFYRLIDHTARPTNREPC